MLIESTGEAEGGEAEAGDAVEGPSPWDLLLDDEEEYDADGEIV